MADLEEATEAIKADPRHGSRKFLKYPDNPKIPPRNSFYKSEHVPKMFQLYLFK